MLRARLQPSLAALLLAAHALAAPTVLAAPAPLPEPAAAPAISAELRGIDLFGLQYASDPQISPDGEQIAYVRVSFDIMTDSARRGIWRIDTRSGAQTPLITGAGAHFSPRFSPDGQRLAYVSTLEDGRPQLFVHWLATGRSTRIAELLSAPDALSWSPDGKQIAFIQHVTAPPPTLGEALPKPEGADWAPGLQVITDLIHRHDGRGNRKPGTAQVHVVDALGGPVRQLTEGPYEHGGRLSWSPDGRRLLVSSNRQDDWQRNPGNTEIYAIEVADARITALTSRQGLDIHPQYSPDGKQIAYLSVEDRYRGHQGLLLQVMNADGSGMRVLTADLDRSIDDVHWAANGRSLYVQYDDHGLTKVARVGVDGRVAVIAEGLTGGSLDRPYTGGQFSVARNGAVAFTKGSVHRPADLHLTHNGRTRQLTALNDSLLAGKQLGEVRKLPVKSSFDQRDIDAWVVLPPGYDQAQRYPLILEIHGGPFAAYGPQFSTDYQLYAAAGYVVLYTNPRGSTSYGDEFANLIHHKYPGNDYDDLMSAVDAAIAAGYADADNLFVTGGSGGGVLTSWIIGKTQRFKAAATQKPVINWTSTALTTDIVAFMPRYWFDKLPWEDPESYWQRSPLSLMGQVRTPTLVVVGDQDLRTPVADSEQYYHALHLQGVPTALVKVPGASHGGLTARPSQSAAKASAILAWFERYRQR